MTRAITRRTTDKEMARSEAKAERKRMVDSTRHVRYSSLDWRLCWISERQRHLPCRIDVIENHVVFLRMTTS